MKSKKVLLVFTGPKMDLPRFPMSLLAIASYIRKKGFKPEVLDLRIENTEKINPDDYLAIGISSMSGAPLKEALRFCKFIRNKNPKIPLIWGGVHVSFFPYQSIKNKYVDIIVKSEGEETFRELLEKIYKGKKFDDIKGTVVLKNNKPIFNPDREFIDLDNLDIPAYDLIDISKYSESLEYFSYESSRGCPHRCKFCYGLNFHKKRWRAKSPEKVIKDLKEIVKLYKPKKIDFVEDNFFVDNKRVRKIAQGIIKNRLSFKWMSFCRADYLSRFDNDFMALLKESKCELLSIGVESGSPSMLKKITKDITPEQVIIATKKCIKHNIMPVMSFIIGIPKETKNEMYETLDFYDRLYRISNRLEINGLFVYGPYPGTPVYDDAVKAGYRPANTIEEWASWKYTDTNNTPWLTKSYKKKLETISIISRFRFFTHRLSLYSKQFKKRKLKSGTNMLLYEIFVPIMKIDANLRWSLRFFSFAPEWDLYQSFIEKKFDKR
ncbi:MAG: B12-binding domain-containing radical SAM protein [Nanoarchaeota archaeon]|nr:B12-binding domain-containing radical SAM protein [Nanoarchaeota archaeon]